MTDRTLFLLLSQVIKLSTPLLVAALGETLAESAGVIILALDGFIMLSALSAFATYFATGNFVLAILAAIGTGALLALVFGFFVIQQRRDQFATGLVVGLLAIAISAYIGIPLIQKPATAVPDLPIPLLSQIPLLGAFFSQDIFVYLSLLLAVVITLYLYRTRPGITARAVGASFDAAARRGVPVAQVQWAHVLMAGALAGLAGAAFSLSARPGWTQNHTLGWGWLALTLVIFGRRNPVWVTVGTYLFTLLSVPSIIQLVVPGLPAQLAGAAPFLLMLVVLLLSSGGLRRRPA